MLRFRSFVTVLFFSVCTVCADFFGCGDSESKEEIATAKEEITTLKEEIATSKKEVARAKKEKKKPPVVSTSPPKTHAPASQKSLSDMKKKPPVVSTSPPKTHAPASQKSLSDIRQRAFSDDATSVEEALFHAAARSAVIMNVQPNKLRVGGSDFRVKRNPFRKEGPLSMILVLRLVV